MGKYAYGIHGCKDYQIIQKDSESPYSRRDKSNQDLGDDSLLDLY